MINRTSRRESRDGRPAGTTRSSMLSSPISISRRPTQTRHPSTRGLTAAATRRRARRANEMAVLEYTTSSGGHFYFLSSRLTFCDFRPYRRSIIGERGDLSMSGRRAAGGWLTGNWMKWSGSRHDHAERRRRGKRQKTTHPPLQNNSLNVCTLFLGRTLPTPERDSRFFKLSHVSIEQRRTTVANEEDGLMPMASSFSAADARQSFRHGDPEPEAQSIFSYSTVHTSAELSPRLLSSPLLSSCQPRPISRPHAQTT